MRTESFSWSGSASRYHNSSPFCDGEWSVRERASCDYVLASCGEASVFEIEYSEVICPVVVGVYEYVEFGWVVGVGAYAECGDGELDCGLGLTGDHYCG